MKKACCLLPLLIGFFSANVVASETFEGVFEQRGQFGQSKGDLLKFRLVLEIDRNGAKGLKGKIKMPDLKNACPKEHEAVGKLDGNKIIFRSKVKPSLSGCGKWNFKGTRTGDLLSGTAFIGGEDRPVELTKK